MSSPVSPEEIVLRRAALLRRYETTLERETTSALAKAFDRLEALLLRQDPTAVSQGWQPRRYASLVRRGDAIIAEAYAEVQRLVRAELVKFGPVAANISAIEQARLAAAAGVVVGPLRLPSRNLLRAIVTTDPIQGAPLRDWWATQSARTQHAFRRELQIGLTRRETIAQIVRRVRGRVIRGTLGARVFQGGIMATSVREATTIVRTAVNEVYNRSTMLTLAENADVVWGMEWVATLDERTCAECGQLDGRVWKLDDPRLQAPPIHPNDRCTLIGVYIPNKPRRRTTYPQWYAAQPEAVQKRIVGPKRWATMQRLGLSWSDSVARDGRPLTMDEMAARLA